VEANAIAKGADCGRKRHSLGAWSPKHEDSIHPEPPHRAAAAMRVISAAASLATVRVIRTDEELVIARSVYNVLGLSGKEGMT
jgi:hypothetical protein